MRRLAVTLVAGLLMLALLAPAALAFDNGQGTYGPANDKVVTAAGFILIAAFPLFVGLMSLLQWQLEKRKARRKVHLPPADWRGGW